MVLLRLRVYPEPVRSREAVPQMVAIFPCYSATAWVPFGQCIHFLLDPYSPSFYSLFVSQNGLHGKIMNKRYGIPLHSIVLLALLLAAGGFARVFPVHPTNGAARLDAPGYSPASPHTGGMPSGFRRGCSILQVKSSAAGPGPSGGVRLSPCPSSDARAACVLSSPSAPALHGAASCPSPFPHLPFLIPFPSSSVHPACGPPVPSLSQG